MPKLKITKVESCQNSSLPKFKIAKLENCQNSKFKIAKLLNCKVVKLPICKLAIMERSPFVLVLIRVLNLATPQLYWNLTCFADLFFEKCAGKKCHSQFESYSTFVFLVSEHHIFKQWFGRNQFWTCLGRWCRNNEVFWWHSQRQP